MELIASRNEPVSGLLINRSLERGPRGEPMATPPVCWCKWPSNLNWMLDVQRRSNSLMSDVERPGLTPVMWVNIITDKMNHFKLGHISEQRRIIKRTQLFEIWVKFSDKINKLEGVLRSVSTEISSKGHGMMSYTYRGWVWWASPICESLVSHKARGR